jgi:hypothetical protein
VLVQHGLTSDGSGMLELVFAGRGGDDKEVFNGCFY